MALYSATAMVIFNTTSKKKIPELFIHFYKQETSLECSSFTKNTMKKEYGYIYSGHLRRKKKWVNFYLKKYQSYFSRKTHGSL